MPGNFCISLLLVPFDRLGQADRAKIPLARAPRRLREGKSERRLGSGNAGAQFRRLDSLDAPRPAATHWYAPRRIRCPPLKGLQT